MAKRGRPKKVIKYTHAIRLRVTKDQAIKIQSAAQAESLDVSSYARHMLMKLIDGKV